jgi:hypothetical protein
MRIWSGIADVSHTQHVGKPTKVVSMRRFLVPAALGLALVACQDQSPEPVRNVTPAHALVQNGHFFFLPPLAPKPSPTGTFNDNFYPEVEICYLNSTRDACDATKALLGTFTRDFGTFDEKVFVVSGQHYGLDWSTSLFGIGNGKYVRLTVRAGLGSPIIFGYVDLYLDTNGKNLANAPANGAVGVRNGSTLAVKFRIEDGALCGNNPECEEGFLTPAGGTFTLPDGTAGLQADAGDVQSGSANVVIERYRGPDACLPTDYPQYEACIRITVFGTITITPGALIDVGFCPEADGTDYINELELGKWDR